jgi:ubiquinone/menaquinone biosynthesis C-methylase UbiE
MSGFLDGGHSGLPALFADFARPPADGRVLDVGCGTGSLAVALAERGASGRVAGIDIAPPYIAFAQSRPAAAAIDFAVGDASGLPYSDRRFTAALAQLSREMRRVVRPGGVVAAAGSSFSASSGTRQPNSTRQPERRATDCFRAHSPCPRVSRCCGARPDLLLSNMARSQSEWIS